MISTTTGKETWMEVPVGKFAIFPELFLIATNIEGEEGRGGEGRTVKSITRAGLDCLCFSAKRGPGSTSLPPGNRWSPARARRTREATATTATLMILSAG